MLIAKLIPWLRKHNIEVVEETLLPGSCRALIFSAELPRFPSGEERRVWTTIILDPGQDSVSDAEVESILRHCWHGDLEIPRDFD
jgi:hypothetical protein